MNPKWLLLPALVSCFFGGYYLSENWPVAVLLFGFGLLLIFYKWRLEN